MISPEGSSSEASLTHTSLSTKATEEMSTATMPRKLSVMTG